MGRLTLSDVPFLLAELHQTFKFSGEDMVTSSLISYAGPDVNRSFLCLVNSIYVVRCHTSAWKSSIILPISKNDDALAKRPISLFNCITKTAKKMVLDRLIHIVGPLSLCIYAFQQGVRAMECITDILAYIDNLHSSFFCIDAETVYK